MEPIDLLPKQCSAIAAMAVRKHKLFLGTADKVIAGVDLKTHSHFANLNGHTGGILALATSKGRLYSGSFDNTIKVWDLKNYTQLATFSGHGHEVHSLAISLGIAFSGSRGKTIHARILNFVPGVRTQTITGAQVGHTVKITSLLLEGGKLFSGCAGGQIFAWDVNANRHNRNPVEPTAMGVIPKHGGVAVSGMVIAGGKLFSAAGNNLFAWNMNNFTSIWSTTTSAVTTTVTATVIAENSESNQTSANTGHDDKINALISAPKMPLFTAPDDQTIKVWNTTTYAVQQTLTQQHTAKVNCLAIAVNYLYSGGDDGLIVLWKLTSIKDDKTGASVVQADFAHSITTGATMPVVGIALSGAHLFACSGNSIRVWNVYIPHKIVAVTTVLRTRVGALFVEEDLVVSQMLMHEAEITALCAAGGRVYSASKDGRVKVWDAVSLSEIYRCAQHSAISSTTSASTSTSVSNTPSVHEIMCVTALAVAGNALISASSGSGSHMIHFQCC